MGWIDLHTHSNMSNDGDFTPSQLMELCFRSDMKVVSLTDHNSIQGLQEARSVAGMYGIEFIPGIELDCTYNTVHLHVLGYGIHGGNDAFQDIELNLEFQEQNVSKKRMELIQEMGIYCDAEEVMRVAKNGVVTGEIIAEMVLADTRNNGSVVLTPYRLGGHRSDNPYVNFYWDFCAPGKHAYIPIHYIDLSQALDLIHFAGGIPILAHPGNNVQEDTALLDGIMNSGIIGIEVFSSYHTEEQISFYHMQTQKYHCIQTCGSDFHGKTKPSIRIGTIKSSIADESLYEQLKKRLPE